MVLWCPALQIKGFISRPDHCNSYRHVSHREFPLREEMARSIEVHTLRISKLLSVSANCIEIGKYSGWNLDLRNLEILAKMLKRRSSRNQEDVGRAL